MNIPDKVNGDQYDAGEFTPFKNESQNAIIQSGQALNAGSQTQLAQALMRSASNGASYSDTGIADAYVLTSIGANNEITQYRDGDTFSFIAGNSNTGASTLQITGLTAATIKKNGYSDDLEADDIIAGNVYTVRYQLSSNFFEISSFSPIKTKIAIIEDQKPINTNGGTFTNGAMRTRDLNTITYDPDSIVSLSSNQITLQAGTYLIEASAPAYSVTNHIARFYNITDNQVEISGTSARAVDGDFSMTRSYCVGVVTIASAKVFELQHQCEFSEANVGFGAGNAYSTHNTYSTVKITKIG